MAFDLIRSQGRDLGHYYRLFDAGHLFAIQLLSLSNVPLLSLTIQFQTAQMYIITNQFLKRVELRL